MPDIVRAPASAIREGGGLKWPHVTPKVHERRSINRLDAVSGQFDDEAAALRSVTRPPT